MSKQRTCRFAIETMLPLNVVVGTKLLHLNIAEDYSVWQVFEQIKTPKLYQFGNITYQDCKFYVLKEPVSIPPEKQVDRNAIVERCRQINNWDEVDPLYAISNVALQPHSIYFVIELPVGETPVYRGGSAWDDGGGVWEGYRGGSAQDDDGVFAADDIQAIIKDMGYKIDCILVNYPLIAVVSDIAQKSDRGYLKFVEEGGWEVEILQHLAGIDSACNHTIRGARIWSVHRGSIILMPVVGAPLTNLINPDAHLWSTAMQLFEAVAFMHQHGVAHMDLKPDNILIPVHGGRLSIIDFNASIWVKDAEQMFRGMVGTDGYIAPELGDDDDYGDDEPPYSPIRADLWTCGKTLKKLCGLCRWSAARETLLDIAAQLMCEDPANRPMMSDVLERMTRCDVDASGSPSTALGR